MTGLANPARQGFFVGIGFAVPIGTAGRRRRRTAAVAARQTSETHGPATRQPSTSRPHPLEQMLYQVKKSIVGQETCSSGCSRAAGPRPRAGRGRARPGEDAGGQGLAQAIGGQFQRIQFTPDLVPADIVGTRIYNQRTGEFQVPLGPVFTNLLLADEINRAPAKVQRALLEVMQERR